MRVASVSVVLFGASKEAQIVDNLRAVAVVPLLTADMMADIDAQLGNKPAEPFDWRLR